MLVRRIKKRKVFESIKQTYTQKNTRQSKKARQVQVQVGCHLYKHDEKKHNIKANKCNECNKSQRGFHVLICDEKKYRIKKKKRQNNISAHIICT